MGDFCKFLIMFFWRFALILFNFEHFSSFVIFCKGETVKEMFYRFLGKSATLCVIKVNKNIVSYFSFGATQTLSQHIFPQNSKAKTNKELCDNIYFDKISSSLHDKINKWWKCDERAKRALSEEKLFSFVLSVMHFT